MSFTLAWRPRPVCASGLALLAALSPPATGITSAAAGTVAPHAIVWTSPGVGISSCPGPVPPGYAACNATLTVAPASQTAAPGGTARYLVGLRSDQVDSSPARLDVSGLPSGVKAAIQPGALTPTATGSQALLTLAVGERTAAGDYPLQLTAGGSDGSEPHVQAQVVLRVAPSAAAPS